MTEAMTDSYTDSMDGAGLLPKGSYYVSDDVTITVYKATQSDVNAIRTLVERADCKYEYLTEIQDIINEEADYYFAGQKSVEEVMSLIQNRVSLYIAEQMD